MYTSAAADGVRAEIFFHLDRGQPVFPSTIAFNLFELHLRLEQGLQVADIESLPQVGIDAASFGSLSYVRLGDE